MGIYYPFQPVPGSGVLAAPNAGAVAAAVKPGCRNYCVTNRAATICYVRELAGDDTTAASVTDQAILGNTQIVLSKAIDTVALSTYCAGVGDLQITSGNGN